MVQPVADGIQTKRTTIYDLAALAGTSASAVSAVLNGNWKKRRISEKLAERIRRIADEQGYAVNMQASALRRERSRIVGMIVPMYDNRYFGSIVEKFEQMARDRGLFPIITCTQRDPDLEVQAARAMLSYQVEFIVATGATDPDHISDICRAAGIRSFNLDLPGTKAPSVLSDNFGGARTLTRQVLQRNRDRFARNEPLVFVGGRAVDNTAERIRGFRAAHADMEIAVREDCIIACGYAAQKAEQALTHLYQTVPDHPHGMFVNSTISLEGVLRWIKKEQPDLLQTAAIGCFDFDPLVDLLSENILMVKQDVPTMLDALWRIIAENNTTHEVVEIPPVAAVS
ncbi:MAG: LacI family transcriptional regulator fructose operon transcriptional repressor [Rhodobacteraceae bacterium]|nr:MAG: LacI family transcriptional regulator fructose operon transcriptional repressor [Paracoccaceae bacterium]